jgi:hypothetical protein
MSHPLLGKPVKDIITGFTGIVIGVTKYITGRTQALVAPRCEGNELKDSVWFDTPRLQETGGPEVILNTARETLPR